jgi:Na+-transporting methylmalonyl-CoA/oxaloacetate decarboxylase gamma subunit
MSSDTPRSNIDEIDIDIEKGFMVVGIVILFLIFLVILRYGCNICIDIVILQDSASFMRTVSDIRRRFVPWYHPRTQPQQAMPTSADVESGQELINMDRILTGLTPQQKKDLLASILTTKVRDFHLALTFGCG